MRRQLDGQTLDLESQQLAEIDDALLLEHCIVRYDNRVQPLGCGLARTRDAEDAQLLDKCRLSIVRFDFLGIQILAGGEDDDLFLAAGDVQAALRVEPTEVAGVSQPSSAPPP